MRKGPDVCLQKTGLCVFWCLYLTSFVYAQDNAEIVTEIGADKVVDEMILADPRDSQASEENKASAVIKREQVSQISRSLKSVIEQNRKLSEERDRLDAELRHLRGVQRFEKNKIKDAEDENMKLLERIEQLQKMEGGRKQMLKELQDNFSMAEEALKEQIASLQQQIEDTKKAPKSLSAGRRIFSEGEASFVDNNNVESGDAGLGLIAMLDALVHERKQADEDEAQVHYNMGNVFFHRGDYKRAADEYSQAIEIDPSNANAHFNLALLLGDYQQNYQGAIKHYTEYLYLNPHAEDRMLVKEKILEAKLALHSNIPDMSVEKDLRDHRAFNYTW